MHPSTTCSEQAQSPGSGPTSNTHLLWTHMSQPPNSISNSSAILCKAHPRYQHTDRQQTTLHVTSVTHPNGISISSAVFAWLMNITNRQTDHCSNRPHLPGFLSFLCSLTCCLAVKLWANGAIQIYLLSLLLSYSMSACHVAKELVSSIWKGCRVQSTKCW